MSEQNSKKRERRRTPNNRTTTGFRISDELRAVLQPLLPVHVNTHRFGGGRPRRADRACADAIFYVLRTGCQWHMRSIRRNYVRIQRRMIGFKRGSKLACFSDCGKLVLCSLINCAGSSGIGWRWMER